MRLLHTSDWHIGRQLHGASLLEDQAHVLEQVVDIAGRESVDAVILAGDVYDRAVPPAEAVALLNHILRRLCLDLNIPVIVIGGNHDNGQRLGFGADLLGSAGLHIRGPLEPEPRPITLRAAGAEVDVFALPYAGPATVRQVLGEEVFTHEEAMDALLARVARVREAGRPTVLAAHCFVAGASECESERPLSIGGADRISAALFQGFDYVALGHLHGRQYQLAEHIRYSGSILKYSFSEVAHHKSVTLVDIGTQGVEEIRQVELQPMRDMRVLEGRLEEIIDNGAGDSCREDFIQARITNRESVLDAMGKLRAVYPNALQLQYVGLREAGVLQEPGRDVLTRSHLRLFEEFFEEVHGETLSDAQRACVGEVLERVESGDTA
jgi:exonuclease SbcD